MTPHSTPRFLPSGRFRLAAAALALLLPSAPAWALELHDARTSPLDLAVRGQLNGVAAGTEKYVSWPDLRALPSHLLKLPAEFLPGEQEVTVIFLDDLWAALPVAPGADTVLASCADGYASVYRREFIGRYRPFLVLEINGQGPDKWPPPGLTFNPAPYVISVAASVSSGVAGLLDANHKKPWGVTTLEFASFTTAFQDALSGRWTVLSARATAGRELWVNSCASCHSGPGRIFGGTKSGQPFAVLQAIARENQDFFKLYVRNPLAANPAAKMEAHPHYSDEQLTALIAFISAEQAK